MSWFTIEARGTATIELLLYGDIGIDSLATDTSISARQLLEQLKAIAPSSRIQLRINSFGGSVADGLAIYNALRSHPGGVDVQVDGIAASIASCIAMVGRRIRIAENALIMVHGPWSGVSAGNAPALREQADLLDKFAKAMTGCYARSKLGPAKINSMLTDGENHWFSAEEAVAAGLADEIVKDQAIAASLPPNCRFIPPTAKKGEHHMPATTTTPAAPSNHDPMAALLAENRRIADICASFRPYLGREGTGIVLDACLEDPSCDIVAANKKLLEHMGRDCQPIGVGVIEPNSAYLVRDTDRDFVAAATDALMIRAGLRVENPAPQARDLQRHSLVTLAETALSRRGISTRSMSRPEIISAAMTGSDFPNLLSNVAGKSLRRTYDEEPGTAAIWTAERDVVDFKPQTVAALSAAPELLEVSEGGEYTYGAFSDSAETFSVKTYGRVFEITRQALINDDLGAFTNQPAAFARSARRLESDLVYAKLTGTSALSDGNVLFHASHGNLAAAAALSLTSLAAARALMRKQKGLAGEILDPQPKYLIVPVALETTAESLISSLFTPADPSGVNSWARGLTVVADPRLDVSSTTAWFLAADPMQFDTIVRAYLAGQERPYFEENQKFERDAMSIKSRLDFAVGVIDWRGLLKNPGA